MGGIGRKSQFKGQGLAVNLPQLQNLIKRDANSYKPEFLQQWRHWESQLEIFKLGSATASSVSLSSSAVNSTSSVVAAPPSSANTAPSSEGQDFGNLALFLAHVSSCYPEETKSFPTQIIDLLEQHQSILSPDVRFVLVQTLILLRNKSLVSSQALLPVFFKLFRCPDKALRQLLHKHIVSDVKSGNAKGKNNKLNKTFQNFMYTMLKDSSEIAARKSLEVMIDLYKKNVWNDAKTVNVIAEACFSQNVKLVALAVHFFLGSSNDSQQANDDDDDNNNTPMDMRAMKHVMSITKKTKARKNQLDKAIAASKRKDRKNANNQVFNFPAVQLINDPQGFSEKLFVRLKSSTASIAHRFPLRLDMMNLLTRLIGIHKLIVLGYYDFIIPYLKPAQQQVTRILAYTAQASHDLVPPDVIAPVVQAVADNFIWGNCSSEVVCAGMNGLREIVARCPLSMSESLLQSLMADYKNHKEKGVMMASRSLLGLFREINPELLKKRDRGKNASIALQSGVFSAPQYGHVKVSSTLAGLEEEEEEERGGGGEEEDGDEGWDDEEDDGEQQGDDDLDQLLDGLSELGSEDFEEFQEDSDLEEVAEEEEEMEGEDEEKKVSLTNTTAVRKSKKLSSQMAYEKILTDEDFKRLRKQQRGDDNDNGNQSSDDSQEGSDSDSSEEEEEEEDNRPGDIVDEGVITSGIKRKMDYAARMESIMAGREGREKFGSKKSKTERSSITNKVKSKKNKAFMMMVHKRSVKGKAKRSLRDKQKILRQHIVKQKKKGH